MNKHTNLVEHAAIAFEAVRSLNHATILTALPAPVAYDLLGYLHQLGYALDQLSRQVAVGLERSLNEYAVYDNNREPQASVAMARGALLRAASHGHRLGLCLAEAQSAINQQGYNLADDEGGQ